VIHAASMRLGGTTTAQGLRESARNSLARANENRVRSIAFPAVGTGIAGFPMEECAKIMLDEAVNHLAGETSIAQIRFVLFDRSALTAFEQVWTAMKTRDRG